MELLLEKHRDLAVKILQDIGPFLVSKAGKPDHVKQKYDGTVVTNVDPEIESLVRAQIREVFPEHGIMGEELPAENPDSEFQWVIDPIDGTAHFIHGIPVYGSIIALYHQQKPVVGVISVPQTGDIYHAIKGKGAYWNNQEVTIQDVSQENTKQGILAISSRCGFLRSGYEDKYDQLIQSHPEALMLPNCYGHGLAVRDSVTGMINFNINLWDIAATKLLVEEAGGKFVIQKRENLFDMICGKPSVVDSLVQYFGLEVYQGDLMC